LGICVGLEGGGFSWYFRLLQLRTYVPAFFVCIHSSHCISACAATANVNLGILYDPATLVPIILYAVLYVKALRLKKEQNVLASAVAAGANDSSLIQKKEQKATVTFFLFFVSVIALTAPVLYLSLTFVAVNRAIGSINVIFSVHSESYFGV